MKCAYCKYNDGAVYTSNPPKYRCSVTGEYHLALDDCNVEFAPVKHGRWIKFDYYLGIDVYKCSECGMKIEISPNCDGTERLLGKFCENCGARMDEVETYTINAGEV